MDCISLFGIAAGLAMDAFAVCLSNGAVTRRLRFRFALLLSATFGIFQAAMPILGWLIGKAGEGLINSVDHWIALLLLGYIGMQTILESQKQKRENNGACARDQIPFRTVLTLAVATSIDALATGVILPSAVGASTVSLMLFSVCVIGAITFFLCLAGVYLGKKFGSLLSCRAGLAGGLVLIAIGIKIFCDHVFG